MIRYVFCDARRTIAVEAWDARRGRRSWGVTYVDPTTADRTRRRAAEKLHIRRPRAAFALLGTK